MDIAEARKVLWIKTNPCSLGELIDEGWKSAFASPSRQARDNATRLGNLLKADHINQFVEPAVVWANQESSLAVENPSTVIWRYDHIFDELGNIWQSDKLSVKERKKITDTLTKLCEEQKMQGNDRSKQDISVLSKN